MNPAGKGMTNETTVLYELTDHTARITLNRPDKLNAINTEMREGLAEALRRFESEEDAWIGVFAGAGGNFSVGLDLSEADPESLDDEASKSIENLYVALSGIWKPTIALVDGYCLAQGGGIALACDIRIATSRAVFGWPQARRGLSSISGPAMLSAKAPLNFALEFLFTGDFVQAETARELNLVNRVVDAADLESEADSLLARIGAGAPLAMRTMKRAAVEGQRMPLDQRVRMAGQYFTQNMATADAREGMSAFVEKRTPRFRGE
jgi:E-phenylitaconyl-CoA hydratase